MHQDQQEQEQEWIVVKSRKRKHIEKEVKPEKVFVKGGSARFSRDVNVNLEEEFLAHPHTASNMKTLRAVFQELAFSKIHVSCLGIGNFAEYLKPQLQMLFFRHCILQQLSQMGLSFQANVYDPLFTPQEKQEVRSLEASCEELTAVQESTSYVMFMPHCDRFLYEQLCQLRTGQPNCQIIVVGNSINEYRERCVLTQEPIPETLQPYSPKDVKIRDFREAFNDTFVYFL